MFLAVPVFDYGQCTRATHILVRRSFKVQWESPAVWWITFAMMNQLCQGLWVCGERGRFTSRYPSTVRHTLVLHLWGKPASAWNDIYHSPWHVCCVLVRWGWSKPDTCTFDCGMGGKGIVHHVHLHRYLDRQLRCWSERRRQLVSRPSLRFTTRV